MSIREVFQSAFPTYQVRDKGHECSFPHCPKCGMRDSVDGDRLTIWDAAHGKDAHCYCRNCNWSGSAAYVLHALLGIPYYEALEMLGRPSYRTSTGSKSATRYSFAGKGVSATQAVPLAKAVLYPSAACMDTYKRYMDRAFIGLTDAQAKAFLEERRLTVETARNCYLGWLCVDKYESKHGMGLRAEGKALFPAGLYIGIRRKVEGETRIVGMVCRPINAAKYQKYRDITSGTPHNIPYFCFSKDREHDNILWVVESAICAVTIWQETGGHVSAMALNGKGKQIDQESMEQIRTRWKVLIVVSDNDIAGEGKIPTTLWDDLQPYIAEYGLLAYQWRPRGMNAEGKLHKDVNDMLQAGENVEQWILDGAQYVAQQL